MHPLVEQVVHSFRNLFIFFFVGILLFSLKFTQNIIEREMGLVQKHIWNKLKQMLLGLWTIVQFYLFEQEGVNLWEPFDVHHSRSWNELLRLLPSDVVDQVLWRLQDFHFVISHSDIDCGVPVSLLKLFPLICHTNRLVVDVEIYSPDYSVKPHTYDIACFKRHIVNYFYFFAIYVVI